MNRLAARNALGTDRHAGMADAFAYMDAEPPVRAGILTGAAGEFCARTGKRPAAFHGR